MASDLTKWADHAYTLITQGQGLIKALYAAKHILDMEDTLTDHLLRGGVVDTAFSYRGTNIICDALPRPPLERLIIFLDCQFM